MPQLEEKLNAILEEKTTKIIPENIKKGITAFGVKGALEEGTGGTGGDTILEVTGSNTISIEGNTLVIGGNE